MSCSIIVSKDGYEPVAFQLQRSLSGWYIANILIGGVIGFIVDAADGAMFNQSPSQIHAVLYPPLAQSTTAKVRIVNSPDSVLGCTFVADTDPQMRCPKPYEEPSACIAWQAATRYGGNTVLVDGEQGHVYRCEVKSK